jgi:DNA-binding response OmpR family regulator
MPLLRVLLVDDNEDIRAAFKEGLESRGFEVIPASSVVESLQLIASQHFDVLISDLHMPDASDGFTVVSAMRRTHPKSVTLVMSGFPALQEAMSAILLQADEVLVKPVRIGEITATIERKLSNRKSTPSKKENVAAILERESDSTIQAWLELVEKNEELNLLPLSFEDRTGHLPKLLLDLVHHMRIRVRTTAPISIAAGQHGALRRRQGYTVPMVVEESRILQVCIFKTLQDNMGTVDFSTVLRDVITIADEVDAQLKEQLVCYIKAGDAPAVKHFGSAAS